MKQVIQNFKTGELYLGDVPPPALKHGGVLVRTVRSLISAGTERGTVSVGQSSLVGKARQRPDLVRQVVDNVRREGLAATVTKVRTRLESLKPLGYSAAGTVAAVGEGVSDLRVGDRVACAGANYASHAEVIFVPRNLCTLIPTGVTFDAAAYTTLGAIAMQGVRQADLRLGETAVVIGLGLIGQLTLQLLGAAGCRAIGIDVDPAMVALAGPAADLALLRSEDVLRRVEAFTNGIGADAVLITASTSSNDPIELAGALARDRARVVVVGLVPVEVPRSPYYEKELEVRMSRSYGPGRYDPEYEERGCDYPVAYVRWTEGRNMAAFLDLIASGRLNPMALTTHRFALESAVEAYDVVLGKAGTRPCGILLEYGEGALLEERIERIERRDRPRGDGRLGVGFVGAGNFATASLIPPLKKIPAVDLTGVATSSGLSAKGVADKFEFAYTASGIEQILDDPATQTVFIATRHNLHHSLAALALRAGRAVFVEKPLALDRAGLREVVDAARSSGGQLLVGFNRRFAPLARQLRACVEGRVGPAVVHYRVNAGFVPRQHWTQDRVEGGGRIIGEACHFIDFVQYITGALPVSVAATAVRSGNERETDADSVAITIALSDGSLGSILYVALGDKRFPKERCEVFADGGVAVLDDFRSGFSVRNDRERKLGGGPQDKGHAAEIAAFVEAVRSGGASPIALDSLVATTLASFAAVDALRTGTPLDLTEELRGFGVEM
jgi:predicted dehydrogenase/threonine dehydrogenase-like Zn-dependent dehydrogenase